MLRAKGFLEVLVGGKWKWRGKVQIFSLDLKGCTFSLKMVLREVKDVIFWGFGPLGG